MILIITIVVMLGSLFGAVSYLLKMSKTDLPIVNPTEKCAKAGEKSSYSSLGPSAPTPKKCCKGLVEIYAGSRYEPDKEYADENGCIHWVGSASMCSDCGNGICESWENRCNCFKDCVEKEVVITTDKMEYEQGETVKIIVENSTDKSIRIYTPLLGIERFDNDWVSIGMVLGMCGVTGGYVYEIVESYDTVKYNWDQKEKSCNEPIHVVSEPVSRQVSDGIYRIKSIKMDLNNSDNKQTIYSNEFTIKEKSAVDARRCKDNISLTWKKSSDGVWTSEDMTRKPRHYTHKNICYEKLNKEIWNLCKNEGCVDYTDTGVEVFCFGSACSPKIDISTKKCHLICPG